LELLKEQVFFGNGLFTFLGCTSKFLCNFAATAFDLCLLVALNLCLSQSRCCRKALRRCCCGG
jgi:hypothetical protein